MVPCKTHHFLTWPEFDFSKVTMRSTAPASSTRVRHPIEGTRAPDFAVTWSTLAMLESTAEASDCKPCTCMSVWCVSVWCMVYGYGVWCMVYEYGV
jgi:hypothetical protein